MGGTVEMIQWWWTLIAAVVASGLSVFLLGVAKSGSDADDQSENFWAGVEFASRKIAERDVEEGKY